MKSFVLKLSALSAALVVAGCGDGGGSPFTSVSGVAVDGYLRGAKVCLDLNANFACDGGEPTTRTGPGGTYQLNVPYGTDISNAHVVLEADAQTFDEGLGGTLASLGIKPYVLAAPATAADAITPLTTLISNAMVAGGLTKEAAEAAIVASLNLPAGTSLLKNDFVAGKNSNLQALASLIAVSIGSAIDANTQNQTGSSPSGSALIRQAIESARQVALANINANGTLGVDTKNLAATLASIQAAARAQAGRGILVSTAPAGALTAAQITGGATGSGLIGITGSALCDVSVQQITYNTIGAKAGETATATAAVLIPSGTGCPTGPRPLLAYAKGTDVQKPRTLANPGDGETFLLMAEYAAQGYAVVATDYLGFAGSNYPYHPYLHADSEASSVIDAIRAARKVSGINLSGKVVLTGYSQGGHSSAATHRAIERDIPNEINVVAGAHLAGPYNLSGSFKLTNAIAGYQFFVPYIVTSWQKVYGNIYTDVNAVFKAPYVTGIENLLPSPTLNYTTLITSGKLPYGPLPNDARDALFQPAFLTDVQSNTNSNIFQAALKNDLLSWNPKAPTLLCGGAGDPTVPPSVHRDVAQAAFTARGLTNVSSVDVDPQIKAAYGPTLDYSQYHGTYEPPFCHQQARAFFNTALAK